MRPPGGGAAGRVPDSGVPTTPGSTGSTSTAGRSTATTRRPALDEQRPVPGRPGSIALTASPGRLLVAHRGPARVPRLGSPARGRDWIALEPEGRRQSPQRRAVRSGRPILGRVDVRSGRGRQVDRAAPSDRAGRDGGDGAVGDRRGQRPRVLAGRADDVLRRHPARHRLGVRLRRRHRRGHATNGSSSTSGRCRAGRTGRASTRPAATGSRASWAGRSSGSRRPARSTGGSACPVEKPTMPAFGGAGSLDPVHHHDRRRRIPLGRPEPSPTPAACSRSSPASAGCPSRGSAAARRSRRRDGDDAAAGLVRAPGPPRARRERRGTMHDPRARRRTTTRTPGVATAVAAVVGAAPFGEAVMDRAPGLRGHRPDRDRLRRDRRRRGDPARDRGLQHARRPDDLDRRACRHADAARRQEREGAPRRALRTGAVERLLQPPRGDRAATARSSAWSVSAGSRGMSPGSPRASGCASRPSTRTSPRRPCPPGSTRADTLDDAAPRSPTSCPSTSR